MMILFYRRGLRVREKIFRASNQRGCGVSAAQCGDRFTDGQVLEEFEVTHQPEGFQGFFSRIEKHQKAQD